ncbi:hypothetical protein PMIN01_06357 [Paraphaeosphaeria minitans]|uniref:Uncharacterized protein n=1 Tax=Paraphaeosphaeria minitans TaxID=565426 RepID=A0A9P6GG02_9PLEO|nr:hypothetical protein PMIN01_06357 [Paraphaeosphaeria minitans]
MAAHVVPSKGLRLRHGQVRNSPQSTRHGLATSLAPTRSPHTGQGICILHPRTTIICILRRPSSASSDGHHLHPRTAIICILGRPSSASSDGHHLHPRTAIICILGRPSSASSDDHHLHPRTTIICILGQQSNASSGNNQTHPRATIKRILGRHPQAHDYHLQHSHSAIGPHDRYMRAANTIDT